MQKQVKLLYTTELTPGKLLYTYQFLKDGEKFSVDKDLSVNNIFAGIEIVEE